jgi:hypothetical protein
MATHVLTIPDWRPVSLNWLLGCHWGTRSRLKRRDRDLVAAYALALGIPVAQGRRRRLGRVVRAWHPDGGARAGGPDGRNPGGSVMDDIDERLDEIRDRLESVLVRRDDAGAVSEVDLWPAAPGELFTAAVDLIAAVKADSLWLLALVAELQGLLADLCEDSRAAKEAVRYRRALEVIASDARRLNTVMSFAREALEGKADDPH